MELPMAGVSMNACHIKSMTGFASQQKVLPEGRLNIEMRAVNSRFLEVNFALDAPLTSLEPQLQKLTRQMVQRGKVDVSISFTPQVAPNLTLNTSLLEVLSSNLEQLHEKFPTAQLNLMDVMNFPGLLQSHSSCLTEQLSAEVLDCMQQTLLRFEAMRVNEGDNLKQVILDKLTQFFGFLEQIQAQMQNLVANERANMLSKIQNLHINVAQDRVEQEIALLAQKSDIAEEYDRLCSHVKALHQILEQPQEVNGKRLDFISQELLRESNTTAAKASNLTISKLAVEFKVLSEQIREQVQNIE